MILFLIFQKRKKMSSWEDFCVDYAAMLGLERGDRISPAEYILKCRMNPLSDGFVWGPPHDQNNYYSRDSKEYVGREVAHSPPLGKKVCPHDPTCSSEEEEVAIEEVAETEMAKLKVAETPQQ